MVTYAASSWFSIAARHHSLTLLSCVIFTASAGTAKGNDLVATFKSKIFTNRPADLESISEYKTGTWSWDVTPILNEIESSFDSRQSFIEAIEESFELIGGHYRSSEEEALNDWRKTKSNRYLDRIGSDRERYFSHSYWIFTTRFSQLVVPFAIFELSIAITDKPGQQEIYEINAYLFWRHF